MANDKFSPSHYVGTYTDKEGKTQTLEVYQVLEAFGLINNHYLATAVQYLLRAGHKEGESLTDDAIKALWNIQAAIRVNANTDVDDNEKPLIPASLLWDARNIK